MQVANSKCIIDVFAIFIFNHNYVMLYIHLTLSCPRSKWLMICIPICIPRWYNIARGITHRKPIIAWQWKLVIIVLLEYTFPVLEPKVRTSANYRVFIVNSIADYDTQHHYNFTSTKVATVLLLAYYFNFIKSKSINYIQYVSVSRE